MSNSNKTPLPAIQLSKAPARTHTASSSSTTSKRSSFFGSLKRKISRKSPADSSMTPQGHGTLQADEQPPPAYSEAVAAPPRVSMGSASITSPEDPYAFLSTFDTIFVIDDSGSMAGASWREVRDVLVQIAPVCASRDSDGIDIYFLNHESKDDNGDERSGKAKFGYRGWKDSAQVVKLFERVKPGRATPTGTRLMHILKPYLKLCERNKDDLDRVKPVNIIVITDGVPTDDLEGTVIWAAQKLDKIDAPLYQVGLQFFQVGREPGAREALKELDDEMTDSGIRDIVDTVTWNGREGDRHTLTSDAILKVVLGAVVRRLDRRSVSPQSRR